MHSCTEGGGELAFRTRGESEEGGWMDVAIMVKRGRERRREMRAKSDSIKETF